MEHLTPITAHYRIQENGFRYAPVAKFPYRIVFEVDEDIVVVCNIYHTSRRPFE
ncbi:MAG: hypothetical protein IPL64_10795 [Flavobacteriales bacterium]|nr:hypothetical protein [Flavobacteriales bacterium]MBK8532370.1 hypothetical protein [Flavobacteriales bacterium]MBK8708968.1 hypothetical protein [Flavobacteriales bacterium]MBK9629429.1 hypothetical protein [Flavobacteriales bacterium]MBP8876791.1 hypothetical protein [Flavobacteriales bacterium]